MIDIYGYNLKIRNTTVKDRTKILTIPANNPGELHFINPTVKNDMGNADSMEFSLQSGTPYYDAMQQMITYIEVEYDGDFIFFGRVLTIENGAFGTRKIKCEGALSFLIDSQYPGSKEEERNDVSTLEYIQALISNHNTQMSNDPYKMFYVGEVPGNYTSVTSSVQQIKTETRAFGNTSWKDTKSNLEELRDRYGGLFRVRRSNGKNYIDWLNNYFRSAVNDQKIEIGKNLIDISDVTEVNNIFTALIPIGKPETGDVSITLKGYREDIHGNEIFITVPQICNVYSANELNSGYHTYNDYHDAIDRYGMVFKTQEFSEAHTQEQLFNDAFEWIKENYQGGIDSFTVKAIDMHQIGNLSINKILVGDRVTLIYKVALYDGSTKTVTKTLTCTSVNYDLYNPEANSYSFGIPSNLLKTNYDGKKAKKVKSNASTPEKTSSGGGNEESDKMKAWINACINFLWNHQPYNRSNKKSDGTYSERKYINETDPDGFDHFMLPSPYSNRGRYALWVPQKPVMTKATIKGFLSGKEIQQQSIRYWSRFSSNDSRNPNLPKGGYIFINELTHDIMNNHKLFEYIIDEYGIDLRTGLKVKMPEIVESDDGKSVFFYSRYDHDNIMTYSPAVAGLMAGAIGFAEGPEGAQQFCQVMSITNTIGAVENAFDGVTSSVQAAIEDFCGGYFNYSTAGDFTEDITSGLPVSVESLTDIFSGGTSGIPILDQTLEILGSNNATANILDKFKGYKEQFGQIKNLLSNNDGLTGLITNFTANFTGDNGLFSSITDSFGIENLLNYDDDANLTDNFLNLPDTNAKAEENKDAIGKLKIQVLNSETEFGSLVDGYFLREPNGEYKPQTYKFCQAIEQYKGGEMVVAYVEGNVVRLGNPATAYNYAIAYKEGANIVGALEYVKDSQGIERLYIHSGGGVRVRRGTVDPETGEYIVDSEGKTVYSEFGIYDENNLTAGVITTMINGSTFDFIKGDHVVIGDYGTYKNVVNAFNDVYGDVDELEGLVAEKASIVELNALKARVHDLEVDDLTAKIGRIATINCGNIASSGYGTFTTLTANSFLLSVPAGTIGPSATTVSMQNAIKDANVTLSSNTYTLHLYNMLGLEITPSDGHSLTFSRAVSTWTQEWTDGNFVVTANPQGQSCSTNIVQGEFDWNNDWDTTNNTASIPIEAINSNSPNLQIPTGRNVWVNAQPRYNAGWAAARTASSLPDTGDTSSDRFTAKRPSATVGNSESRTYKVTVGQEYGYIKTNNSSGQEVTIARVSHTYYKDGWAEGYNTFDSSGTTATKLLNYDEQAVVTVKQKNKDGSVITRLSRTYTAPPDRYNTGKTDGINSVYKITLDSNGNHVVQSVNGQIIGTWFNYTLYNSGGTNIRGPVSTDGKNSGLFFPYMLYTATANGTYEIGKYTHVLVNVPDSGGEQHTHSRSFHITITYNTTGTRTVTLTSTYGTSESVPFNDNSDKRFYW